MSIQVTECTFKLLESCATKINIIIIIIIINAYQSFCRWSPSWDDSRSRSTVRSEWTWHRSPRRRWCCWALLERDKILSSQCSSFPKDLFSLAYVFSWQYQLLARRFAVLNGMKMRVCVCLCVWTGMCIYANVVHTSNSFHPHTHARTHARTFSYHLRTTNRWG